MQQVSKKGPKKPSLRFDASQYTRVIIYRIPKAKLSIVNYIYNIILFLYTHQHWYVSHILQIKHPGKTHPHSLSLTPNTRDQESAVMVFVVVVDGRTAGARSVHVDHELVRNCAVLIGHLRSGAPKTCF